MHSFRSRPRRRLAVLLAVVIVFAVACGSSGAPNAYDEQPVDGLVVPLVSRLNGQTHTLAIWDELEVATATQDVHAVFLKRRLHNRRRVWVFAGQNLAC